MGKAIFVIGTGTDVGKSALSLATLLWAQDQGLRTAYYKPIQCGTFAFGDTNQFITDAEWISVMLGQDQPTHVTYSLRMAASPHLAAERESIDIDLSKIRHDIDALASAYDLLIIESAGGAAVPLNRSGVTFTHLAAELSIPCLLACAPGLGTLHHTITTASYLELKGAPLLGFVFCHRAQVQKSEAEICIDNRKTLESLLKKKCYGELDFCPELTVGGKAFQAKAANWYEPISSAMSAWWHSL